MTNGNSAERERFEKWYKTREQHDSGMITTWQHTWEGWQARAALSACADGGKGEAVGYAEVCDGSGGDFTMAVFNSSDVPEGTALFTSPQAECAPREAQPVADTVRECLSDVVSHYRALYAGLAFQLNEAVNIDSSDDMAYWKHEMKALERMYAQAESALAAPTPERAQESYWQKAAETLERANVELSCAYVELKKKLRAQESAGVRLTPEQSGAIQIAISILTPEYLLTANRLRSIVATIDAELAKKEGS
jgi:hypothetical protein